MQDRLDLPRGMIRIWLVTLAHHMYIRKHAFDMQVCLYTLPLNRADVGTTDKSANEDSIHHCESGE